MNNTEREMISAVFSSKRRLCTNYDIAVPNCYTSHDNEADLFFIRKSGLCDEVEVKISRTDLLSDKNKRVHYRQSTPDDWYWKEKGLEFAPYTKPKYEALLCGEMPANYFWYAIKQGIGDVGDIPDFAGLIIVLDNGNISIARQPKRLHSQKLTSDEKYNIARKLGYRFWKSEFGIQF